MSLAKLVLPILGWSELNEIISFLNLKELWKLGCCNRSAFITFLRERSLRKCKDYGRIPTRFLSKLSEHEKVSLISYPRSGNSFMRKLIENEFNIVTGSDSRPNRTLAASLLEFGYQGEAITDNSVWVVKSHYPERLGYIRYPSQRVVLIIRNPFDAIESYFHMAMTNTHDKSLTKEIFLSLKDLWGEFVLNEAKIWVQFHEFWLNAQSKAPILFLRYEDLVLDKESAMMDAKRFLLEGRAPTGLQRFTVGRQEYAASAGYQPKKITTFGKGLNMMSDEEKTFICTQCGKLMQEFGYQTIEEADPTSLEDSNTVITGLQVLTLNKLAEIQPQSALLLHRSGYHNTGSSHTTTNNSSATTTNSSNTSINNKNENQNNLIRTCTNNGVSSIESLYINDYFTIRPKDDKFGRGVTETRKSLTKNDTVPFPTI